MDERRVRREGRPRIDHRGQRLAIHRHELGRVHGLARPFRADRRDRLADEAKPILREGRTASRPEASAFQSRGERAHPFGQIMRGENGGHAGRPSRETHLGVAEHGMRMGAAREGRVKQSGNLEVVEVRAPPGQEARILDALDARAGEARSRAQRRTVAELRAWRPGEGRRRPGARAAPSPS